MEVKFNSIDNPGKTAVVDIELEIIGSGAQGSVHRATVDGKEGYCVKALSGIAAGAVREEVSTFRHLRRKTLAQLEKPTVLGILRTDIQSLYHYLPELVAYDKLPGYDQDALLLCRPFCPGIPLRDLLVEPPRRSSEIYWRLSIAKRICRLMVSLDLFGFVHLDPYPDNVLVENPDNLNHIRISVIDLEGVGVLSPDDNSAPGQRKWRDEFERTPKAFLKEDYWPLPWWYPTPGKTRPMSDWFIYAAAWQMLSIVTYTLTWGATPGCWLDGDPDKGLPALVRIAEQARKAQRVLTQLERLDIEDILTRYDGDLFSEFVNRCGSEPLAHKLIDWFTAGFYGPRGDRWYWFKAIDLQMLLNETRVN